MCDGLNLSAATMASAVTVGMGVVGGEDDIGGGAGGCSGGMPFIAVCALPECICIGWMVVWIFILLCNCLCTSLFTLQFIHR